ncbi:MAG: histidinol-phosphatase HisJ family protein [Clostridia bacterium]
MEFINKSDSHNHSNCSFDGHNSILEICEKAKELNLLYITITDHCECNQYNDPYHNYKTSSLKSYKELQTHQNLYSNLLIGIELGQAMQNLQAAEHALKRDYDFVLGSLHNLHGLDDFVFWSEVTGDCDKYLSAYLKQIKEMVQWGKFNALSHLTYPIRYIRTQNGQMINFDNFHEEISEIFKMMIEKNIALEINCADVRKKSKMLVPDLPLIKLYKSLGGKYITVGSDAHFAKDIGFGIEKAYEALLEAGFTQYTVFIKRKPIMIDIKRKDF